jgi:hypothetical protein
VKEMAAKLGGYVANENDRKDDTRQTYTISLRIPAKNFDALLSNIDKEARAYDEKSIDINDVTAEYMDVETRIKNKKITEEKFLALLKQTNSVEDIIKIQENLGNIRSEIESIEGQLKYMANQVDYSTLHVEFYKNIASKYNFWNRLVLSVANGWSNLLGFIELLVGFWPFYIVGAVVYYVIKKYFLGK